MAPTVLWAGAASLTLRRTSKPIRNIDGNEYEERVMQGVIKTRATDYKNDWLKSRAPKNKGKIGATVRFVSLAAR